MFFNDSEAASFRNNNTISKKSQNVFDPLGERYDTLRQDNPLTLSDYPEVLQELFLILYQAGGADGKQCFVKRAVGEVSESEIIAQGKTIEEVQKLQSYGGIIRKDYVLFDMDDAEEADAVHKMLLKMGVNFISFATKKGYHFYFKAKDGGYGDGRDMVTPVIVHADFKNGVNRSVDALKKNGIENIPVHIIDPSDLDELPAFLIPLECGHTGNGISYKHKDYIPRVVGKRDGEGRGVTIFGKLRWFWKKHGYSREEAQHFAELIDRYLFAEPVAKGQITHIFRKKEWDAIKVDGDDNSIANGNKRKYREGNRFLAEDAAVDLIEQNRFIILNDIVHVQDENSGLYISDEQYQLRLVSRLDTNITEKNKREILAKLRTTDRINLPDVDINPPHEIYVLNGVLDVRSLTLRAFDKENDVFLHQIPINYNPNAYSEKMDEVLTNFSRTRQGAVDNVKKNSLLQIAGYCLYNGVLKKGKAFIFWGNSNCGKSLFGKLCQVMINKDYLKKPDSVKECKALSLDAIEKERFSIIALKDAWLNLCDELSTLTIKDGSRLKQLFSHEFMKAEAKGRPVQTIKPMVRVIMTANQLPDIKDPMGALHNRLVYVKFCYINKDVGGGDRLLEELVEDDDAMEYFFAQSVKGLQSVLLNPSDDCFNLTEEDRKTNTERRTESDEVELFMQDVFDGNPMRLCGCPTKLVHALYKDWYVSEICGNDVLSQTALTRRLKTAYDDKLETSPIDFTGNSLWDEDEARVLLGKRHDGKALRVQAFCRRSCA